jgi:DNA-binding NarL/FixJ family response regulator
MCRHPTTSAASGLTKRETQIPGWVAEGESNRGIATIRSISPSTVEKHLERTFEKLSVENRTAAAARFRQVEIQEGPARTLPRAQPSTQK